MAAALSTEQQFLDELPTIDRISSALARRRGLVGADADDFSAHVRGRFVESGYAAFAQFRGEASMSSYLTVVIARWLKDYLIARDGRWRPSAAALRAGPVAVLLERLVSRQGCSADEAITRVLSGGDHSFTERDLRAMLRTLPPREVLRPMQVSTESATEIDAGAGSDADARIRLEEEQAARKQAAAALHGALNTLPAEDRLLVSMRFLDGQSVADIARALGLLQKPLYRRLDKALMSLKRQLESAGLNQSGARALFAGDDS